jgi:aminoacyl tRNA synthase complex-interacting multifunctional protein 1
MQDKMVVLVCNLKPSKLRGVLSEAMVLCASTPEKVELMLPPSGAQIGDRVTVEGFEGEPAPECNPKNNIFGLVQPDLLTNDSLIGTYKGKPLEIKGKGPLKSSTLKNVPIK